MRGYLSFSGTRDRLIKFVFAKDVFRQPFLAISASRTSLISLDEIVSFLFDALSSVIALIIHDI